MATPSKPERRGVVAELADLIERDSEYALIGCLIIGLPALAMVLVCIGAVVALLMGWRPWL